MSNGSRPAENSPPVICKSAAAAAAGPGVIFLVLNEDRLRVSLGQSSESQFHSSRKRSNIVPARDGDRPAFTARVTATISVDWQ